ncbi:MAG: sugar phosphate nucleotidyltransferase [candidate division Zixibacteria bacterium]
MKAVIMAGGFGTRLRPLTTNRPKPMVPIAGKPVMEYIVRLLKKHGIKEIVAILYFQSEQIKSYFKNGSKWGVNIKYVTAEADFGTAGAVKNAEEYLDSPFIIISGDVLTDFDLSEAITFHEKKKALSTIVLTRVENPLAYGIVITAKSGKITRFLEKPSWGQVFSDTINTGIYILEPAALELIAPKTEYDFSKDLFPKMLRNKSKLYGYVADGYWKDIGNIEEYYLAHQDLLGGKVSVKIPGRKTNMTGADVYVGENTYIAHGAEFSGTVVLGENVKIGPRARISNSVIGDDSIIGREAQLNRITGWNNVSVGPRVTATESILCSNSYVGENAIIDEECVVSDKSSIGEGAWIKSNVKIWPNKEVESGATLTSSLIWGESWSRELFADAKVTGIGNAEITPEFAAKLGAAYGAIVGSGTTVAVCRGSSDISRMINRAIISGLLSAGVNVADLRTIPIPVMRQVLKSGRMAGGTHVRLNPDGNDNMDIIFFDINGWDLPSGKSKSIERLFFREDFRRASVEETGNLDYPQRVFEAYRESFLAHIDSGIFKDSKFKAVIDYGFSGASEILPGILGAVGIDSVALNSYVDPKQALYFTRRGREAVKQLGSIVKSLNADIGILLNSAAEKIIIVNEKGEAIDHQKALLKVTQLYCKISKPRMIAIPVSGSMGITAVAEKHRCKLRWIPSEHQAMMEAAASGDSVFVSGTRGGFIFPGFQLGVDAMFATVKIFELLVKEGVKIGSITGSWDKFRMATREVACSWGKKGQVMRSLMDYTEKKERILVDGARFAENGGRVLVRPDRNKAQFFIQAEAKSTSEAKEMIKKYVKLIKSWQK